MSAGTQIKFFRGAFVNLPLLAAGEPAFCVDTGELFVGNGTINVPIGRIRVSEGNYGDITVDATGEVWTLADGVVTAAKMAAIATAHVLGRVTAGDGQVEALTIGDLMSFANNFLALGKIEQVATQTLLGRKTAGTGNVEQITIAEALEFLPANVGQIAYRGASAWTVLAPSAVGQVLQTANVGGSTLPTWSPRAQAVFQDQKTTGTNGGTFTSGAWQTRTLNSTVYTTDAAITIGSNRITLGVGDWEIIARAPAANGVLNHQCRVQDITNGTTRGFGSTAYAGTAQQSDSIVQARFNVTGAGTLFEIQHQCNTTQATFGFGAAAGFGSEVYTSVEVRRWG